MRRDRALVLVSGLLAAALALVLLYQGGPTRTGWFPECAFHRLTGLNCPGCGMTRATDAALHGHLAEAFRFNPLGVIVLPVVLLCAAVQIPAWLRDRPPPFRFNPGARGAWWIVGVVVAYWILRNLPAWPLTLPGPP